MHCERIPGTWWRPVCGLGLWTQLSIYNQNWIFIGSPPYMMRRLRLVRLLTGNCTKGSIRLTTGILFSILPAEEGLADAADGKGRVVFHFFSVTVYCRIQQYLSIPWLKGFGNIVVVKSFQNLHVTVINYFHGLIFIPGIPYTNRHCKWEVSLVQKLLGTCLSLWAPFYKL